MDTMRLIFILFLLIPIIGNTQDNPRYSAFKIQDQLIKNANEVVREHHGTYTVLSNKEGVAHYKKVVTILNENSNADHLAFYYSDQGKVSNISIRVFDAHGNQIRKAKKSEITDHSALDGFSIYQDERFKYFRANYHTYPYTVEYSYDKTFSGTIFAAFPDWYFQSAFNSSVEKSTFIVKLPQGEEFHYKLLNHNVNPEKGQYKKYDVYSWKMEYLQAVTKELKMPEYDKVFPSISTSADNFKIENYEGGLSTWEEFSNFIFQLFEGKDRIPEELQQEIKTITASAQSDVEKIDLLYRFMQENMRYVSVQLGLGGWQPFDAEYVYRNKYGDCKALTNYMYAMLKVVGVESIPALIGSGDSYFEVNDDFATSKFNHVILYIPSEDYWLECTSSDYPPNYIGSHNGNRKALLVKKEGGKLIDTPTFGIEKNIQKSHAEINFREDSSAEIVCEMQTTGASHELYRWMANNFSEKETREWFEENTSIPSVSFKTLKVNANSDSPKGAVSFAAESRRLGSKAGKRIFLPLNVINPYENIPPKTDNRRYPIVIPEGYVEIDTIVINLPDGYDVESIPEKEATVKSDFASFEMQVTQQPGKLLINRRLEVHRTELPAEQYDEFRGFYKQIAKLDGLKAVLVRKKT